MKTLHTFILLLAVGIAQAAEQRFVPYNPLTGHTLGGILYTNGTFHGDGAGLTNLSSESLSLSNLTLRGTTTLGLTGTGTTTVTDTGALNAYSIVAGNTDVTAGLGSIVGTHGGDGAALTNLDASTLASGTVSEDRLPVNRSANLTITNSLTIYAGNSAVNEFLVFSTNNPVPVFVISSNRLAMNQYVAPDVLLSIDSAIGNWYSEDLSRQLLRLGFSGTGLSIGLGNNYNAIFATPKQGTPLSGFEFRTGGTNSSFRRMTINSLGGLVVGPSIATNVPLGSIKAEASITASNFVATAGGLTLPVLGAAPAVSGNNAVLWISNSAAPTQWITTTNGTFAH